MSLINYKRDFNEMCPLGHFETSAVFKAERIVDKELFAIKKVGLTFEDGETCSKELLFLSRLKSEFIVTYFESWTEDNYYTDLLGNDDQKNSPTSHSLFYMSKFPLLRHIQMELCSLTLRDYINTIEKQSQSTENTLTSVDYYISSELMYEIIECVQYLHSQSPAIIHRDLKPENILLSKFIINNRFVKLSDFGLTTFHEHSSQSHTRYFMQKNYRAPELNTTTKYSTAADIYSMGVILRELFQIECKEKDRSSYLHPKIVYINNLVKELHSYSPDSRPKCEEIFAQKYSWLLSDNQLLSDITFKQILHKTPAAQSIEENFIEYFIQNKYKVHKSLYASFNLFQSIYYSNFIEIKSLGTGGFSTVFEARHNLNKNRFAIKKVSFNPDNIEDVNRELLFLSSLKCEFIVKYINSWVEVNYYLELKRNETTGDNNLLYSPLKTHLLHIQMELCSLTLREAIKYISNNFFNPIDNTISLIGYYISSELLYEILECVQYLHQRIPAIIHRDLKPENILLTNLYKNNKRIVKLSDFGLSTFHEFVEQSHTKYIGTKNYKATELNYTTKYTTKADIYSLGVIIIEMFQLDINDKYKQNGLLPMNKIKDLALSALNTKPDVRPDCHKMISKINRWRLPKKLLASNDEINKIICKNPKSSSIEENFVDYFVQNKSSEFNSNNSNNNTDSFNNSFKKFFARK